jgi:hypothetical protein
MKFKTTKERVAALKAKNDKGSAPDWHETADILDDVETGLELKERVLQLGTAANTGPCTHGKQPRCLHCEVQSLLDELRGRNG